MIKLKIACNEDINEEFDFITNTPYEENGFTNKDFGVSREDFENIVLPIYIDQSRGIDHPEGRVPSSVFFLWHNDEIIG